MALSDLSTDVERPRRAGLRERWAERGFSAADLLNLWAPLGACECYDGLRYGSAPHQRLDVYRPQHARGAPLVVFFYGGSWQRGCAISIRFSAPRSPRKGSSRSFRTTRCFRLRGFLNFCTIPPARWHSPARTRANGAPIPNASC